MKFNLGTAKLAGEYRLVASTDPEGKEVTKDTGWFGNLITDAGVERIGLVNLNGQHDVRDSILRAVRVGSGSTTPTFTDTSLDLEIASISLDGNGYGPPYISSDGSNYTDGYMHMTVVRQFGEGAAAGNLSEIGLGDADNLFSRALILDEFGSPTTITVLANEYLTVYYTLRVYIPQTDVVISAHPILIDGVSTPHDITIRPNNANSYDDRLSSGSAGSDWSFSNTANDEPRGKVSSGGLVAPTSDRAGTASSSYANQSYVLNSLEKYVDFVWDVNTANFSVSTFVITGGLGSFQFNVDPALAKDNTKEIRATFGFSWARA